MQMAQEQTNETPLKSGTAAEEEVFDPYLYRAPMPLTGMYYPLGFPLRITTNSAEILATAAEIWGDFEQRFATPPIELQVGVRDDGSTQCPDVMTFRAQGQLMVGIADSGNFLIADVSRANSFGWLTPGAVMNRQYLRHHVLESAALAHIANRFTAPLHAACVSHEGRGVLLCGDSGAGKSTLAFACARAGWAYTSDDASFLVQGRNDRHVVGNCSLLRLRPNAAELFDEVKGRPLTPRLTGKPSIEIPTRELPDIHTAVETQADFMVFLRRGDGVQELVSLPCEVGRDYLMRHLILEPELRRAHVATIGQMLSVPVYELRYRDLSWAIERLERMVREGS